MASEKVQYVCVGTCHGVTDVPKNCGAKDCTHYGKPLQKKVAKGK